MTLEYLTRPLDHVESIRERLLVEEGGNRRELTYHFDLPPRFTTGSTLAFPIAASAIGVAVGGFTAEANGANVHVISGAMALEFEAAMVGVALSVQNMDRVWFDEYLREIALVIRDLRRQREEVLAAAVSSSSASTLDDPLRGGIPAVPGVSDKLRSAMQLAINSNNESDTKQLLAFFSVYETMLVRFVPMPGSNSLSVSYPADHYSRKKRLWSRVRNGLDLRPFVFRVETPAAGLARSYELEVVGPSDHFVRYEAWVMDGYMAPAASLRDLEGRPLAEDEASQAPAGRTSRLVLTPASRARSRRLQPDRPRTRPSSVAIFRSAATAKDPYRGAPNQAWVVFNERPPGSLSRAAVYTFLCILTLAVGAYTFKALVINEGISAETAVVLFSLPGTIALWARPRNVGAKSIDPPLVSIVGVFLVALMSYLGGIAFLLADSAAERACAGAVQCVADDSNLNRRGSSLNWADTPLRNPLDSSREPLSFRGFTMTGQLAINLMLAISIVIWAMLFARSLSSVVDYSKAQNRSRPRDLPKKLMATAERLNAPPLPKRIANRGWLTVRRLMRYYVR